MMRNAPGPFGLTVDGIQNGSTSERWDVTAQPVARGSSTGNLSGALTDAAGRPPSLAVMERWNCGAAAFGDALASAVCSVETSAVQPHLAAQITGPEGASGGVEGERPAGASGRAVSAANTTPRGSVGSLFTLDTTEATRVKLLGPSALLRRHQHQPLCPTPGVPTPVADSANPIGGGRTGSATSASDGTVHCPELPATRNASSSPMDSPLPQASALIGARASVDPHSPPLRQSTTPAEQCGATPAAAATPPATAAAAVAGTCSEASWGDLLPGAPADSRALITGTTADAGLEERWQPGGDWRIDPETVKQEVVAGLGANIPNLPQPVRVTVGPNASRQQQQSSLVGSMAKKRGREAAGHCRQQQWDLPDGEVDSDGRGKCVSGGGRGSGGRAAAGRGTLRDADGSEDKAAVYGMFYPERYLVGVDCILVDGAFVSRSRFEKLGNSLMAKWYRSIRVVETDEPLGTWLERHGMQVFTGKTRQRRQRLITPASGPTITAPNPTFPRYAANSTPGGSRMLSAAKAGPGPAGAASSAAAAPVSVHPVGAGCDVTHACISPGGGAGEAWVSTPGLHTDPGETAAHGGGLAFMTGGCAVGADGVARARAPRQQQLQQLQLDTAVAGCALATPSNAAAPGAAAAAATAGAADAASTQGAACAVGAGGDGGPGAALARGGQPDATTVARPSCLPLEPMLKGSVAPGVYVIGGRAGLVESSAPPAGLQPAPQHVPAQQRLQPPQSPQQQPLAPQQHKPLPQNQGVQVPPQLQQQLQQQPLEQPQEQSPQPQGPGAAMKVNWRPAMDGGAPFAAPDAMVPPFPSADAPSRFNAGHGDGGGPAWGPGPSASVGCPAPPGGAAGVSTTSPLSIQRLGGEGDAGPATGGPRSTSAGSAALWPPQATAPGGSAPGAAAPGTTSAGGGRGGTTENPTSGPASSCRFPDTPSLESVPTTAASRWPCGGMYGPAAGGLVPYGSCDASVEGGGLAGRCGWETDALSAPPLAYGALPPAASAPAPIAREAQGAMQMQQHQHYPALSMGMSYEMPPCDLHPVWPLPMWPPPRSMLLPAQLARPREAAPAALSYTHVSYSQQQQHQQQQACQIEGAPPSGGDGRDQATAPAGASAEPPATAPTASAGEAALPVAGGRGSAPAPGIHHTPLPPPRTATARHAPYGSPYWQYAYTAAPLRVAGAPGFPPGHPAGLVGAIRPLYRIPHPREVGPAIAMVPTLPPPPPPQYGYYFGHPYHRRAPPPVYRRRHAVSAPGAAEAPPPPGLYGARYDPRAVHGPCEPARQEPEAEAPWGPARPGLGPVPYPEAGGSPEEGDRLWSPPARAPPPAADPGPPPSATMIEGLVDGARAVIGAGPAAAAGAAKLPGFGSGGGGGATVPGNSTSLPPQQQQQQGLQQQQHPGTAAVAAVAGGGVAACPAGWGAAAAQGFIDPMLEIGHMRQAAPIQGGLDGRLGPGLGLDGVGAGVATQAWRSAASAPASAAVAAAAGMMEGADPYATGMAWGAAVDPNPLTAAAGAEHSEGTLVAANPFPLAALAAQPPFPLGGDPGETDPMWVSFQKWSAEEPAGHVYDSQHPPY